MCCPSERGQPNYAGQVDGECRRTSECIDWQDSHSGHTAASSRLLLSAGTNELEVVAAVCSPLLTEGLELYSTGR